MNNKTHNTFLALLLSTTLCLIQTLTFAIPIRQKNLKNFTKNNLLIQKTPPSSIPKNIKIIKKETEIIHPKNKSTILVQ